MANVLSDQQIETGLQALPRWEREGDSITCTVKLPSFAAALVFVSTVGHLAEAADHHPDIAIAWRSVTLTLSTHSAGGITQQDLDLAAQIAALPMPSA